MQTPDRLADSRVAIVGLGLMGGSLALALGKHCRDLLGIDRDPEVIEQAVSKGVVQRGSTDPARILAQADLIVLAAPVRSILQILAELPDLHPGNPVILDLASTKRQIVQSMAALPTRFEPVGGHPMCGKEKTGLSNADSKLYQNTPFALVSLPSTTPRARHLAEELVEVVGAKPLWLEADCHDRWVAATSHLPYLLSSALALATPEDSRPLVGPGFRSASRLAATSPTVMLDILRTNSDELLSALNRLGSELQNLKQLVQQEEWDVLSGYLAEAAAHRKLLSGE